MADNYLYAQRRPDPFQSLLQGFQGGQQIVGNISQQQMASMKNQMLQREMDKEEAVKNALAQYGQPGFSDEQAVKAIMPHHPELAIKIKDTIRKSTKDQIDMMTAGSKLMEQIGPSLIDSPQGYHNAHQRMESILPGIMPPLTNFVDPNTKQLDVNKMNETIKRITTGSALFLEEAKAGIKPPDTRELKVGDKIITQQLNRKTGQYEAIAEAGRWDDKNQLQMRVNPDGTQEIIVGGKPGQLGQINPKTAETDIYKKLMGHEEDSAKINQIIKNYDPQYQTYGGTAWGNLLTIYDKAKTGKISQEQEKYLQDFHTHRAGTTELLSTMLNRLSGAAVSEHEAKRLKAFIPNAGQGWLDGDSPREFESKLKQFNKNNDLAIARLTKWAKEGVIPDKNNLADLARKTPLDSMETILKNRAVSLKAEILRTNPQMPESQVNQEASKRLRLEYNLK